MPYLGNVPAEAYTNTVKDSFNGDGSTTAFTLSQPSTTNNLRVVVENVIQDPTVAYSCSGTTLTFTSAPPSGTANIYAVHLGPATMTAVPPTEINNATTYTSDLTVQGDVGIGTSSADSALHVYKQTNDRSARFQRLSSQYIDITQTSGVNEIKGAGKNFEIGTTSAHDLIVDTNGSERFRVNSSGALLIHTTATNMGSSSTGEGYAFNVGESFRAQRESGPPIIANRIVDDGAVYEIRKNGSVKGSIGTESTWGSGPQFLGSNSRGFIIANPNTSVNEIIPNVDTVGKLGNSSNRWADLYLSGGVYLGGTGSSNLLQDYEIGTFTPTIEAYTGTNPTVGYNTRIGNYVKIGELVHIEINIDLSSYSGGTTNIMMITGLPFAIGNGDCVGSLNVSATTFARTGGYNAPVQKIGSNNLGFLTSTNGGGWGWEWTNIFSSSSAIRITMTYST